MNSKGIVFLALFIFSIFLANWFIQNVGFNCYPCLIPVWYDIYAPSGVLIAGLSFTFRDFTQKYLGFKFTVLAVLLGSFISFFINPFLGIASGLAFLISEFMDLAVYTPLQNKNFNMAVIISNTIGLIFDSILFLYLANISFDFLLGQIIGKLEMTILILPFLLYMRRNEYRFLLWNK